MGELVLDEERFEATCHKQPLTLTPAEFHILAVLARSPGRVFSRSQLLDKALGESYEGYERTIDVHILNLRRKMEADPARPRYIKTVYGAGYKFEAP